MPDFLDALRNADNKAEKDSVEGLEMYNVEEGVVAFKDKEPELELERFTEDELRQESLNAIAAKTSPTSFAEATEPELQATPGMWSPEDTQMGFLEKAGRSLVAGFGDQVVGGVGDIAQVIGGAIGFDIVEGTMLSRWFQDLGSQISDDTENYTSKAYRDQMEKNAWNLKTAMHADFWNTDVAKAVPMLVEMILLSKGASGALKSGATKLAKGAGKNVVAKRGARTFIDKVNIATQQGAKAGLTGEKQSGLLKYLVKDTGDLTNLGLGSMDFVGGGIMQNQLAGLMNSAELVNSLSESGLYTEDELSTMAASSYANNLKYLPIDAMSWGITYGMAGKSLRTGLGKLLQGQGGKKMFTAAQGLKNSAQGFKTTTSPFLKVLGKTIKTVGAGIPEGFEETFQESFEEWSKKRGVQKVTGEELPYDNFMEFYMSKENEATKAISMALGMLGGSGANVMSSINMVNKEAEKQYKLHDKTELLKNIYAKEDTESRGAQIQAAHEMLINNKYHQDAHTNIANGYNQEFVQGLLEQGTIDEDEAANLIKKADKLDEVWDQAKALTSKGHKMNIYGTMAYTNAVFNEIELQESWELEKEILNQEKKFVEEKYSEDFNKAVKTEKLNEIEGMIKKTNEIFEDQIIKAQLAQDIILSGGNPDIIKDNHVYIKGEIVTGLTDEQYEKYYEKTDEEIEALYDKQMAKTSFGTLLKDVPTRFTNAWKAKKDKLQGKQDKEAETKEKPINEEKEIVEDEKTTDQAEEGKVEPGEEKQSSEPITEENEVSTEEKIREPFKVDLKALSGVAIAEDGSDYVAEVINTAANEAKTFDEFYDEVVSKTLLDDKFKKGFQIFQGKEETVKAELKKQYENTPVKKKVETKDVQENPDNTKKENKGNESKSVPTGQDNKNDVKETKPVGKKNEDLFHESRLAKEARLIEKIEEDIEFLSYKDIFTIDDLKAWSGQNLKSFEQGFATMGKQMAVNTFLADAFPNTKIRAYAIKNLWQALGKDAALTWGYSLGNAIFIDERAWDQDDIFMHELSHIYFYASEGEPLTQAILNKAKSDKNLMDKIKRLYPEYAFYKALENVEFENNKILKGQILNLNNLDQFAQGEPDIYKQFAFQEDLSPIILEEAFVFYLQGPLSENYTKGFQIKDERTRQNDTRKWWQFFKTSVKQNNIEYVIDKLNDNKDIGDDIGTVLLDFKAKLGDVKLNSRARDMRAYKNFQITKENFDKYIELFKESSKILYDKNIEIFNKIEEEVKAESATYKLGEAIPQSVLDSWNLSEEELTNEQTEESNAYKSVWAVTSQASQLLKNFTKEYNTNEWLAEKNKALEEGRKVNYSFVDFKEFKGRLMASAKETDYWLNWVNAVISNPQGPIQQAFKDYMIDNFGEAQSITLLRSMYTVYASIDTYASVIANNTTSGEMTWKTQFSKEDKMLKNHIERYLKEAIPTMTLKEKNKYQKSYDLIRTGKALKTDYIKMLLLFSAENTPGSSIKLPGIDVNMISGRDQIYFNNSIVTLKTFFDHYIKKGNVPGRSNKIDNILDEINSYEIIDNVIITSRRFTAAAVAENANTNNTAIKTLLNPLSEQYKQFEEDLKSGMDKQAFLKKHSSITNNIYKTLGAYTNHYVEWIYDTYKDNKTLPALNLLVGAENKNNVDDPDRIDFKDTDANTLYLSDVISFVSSSSNDFLTSFGVYGDSHRHMLSRMPKYNLESKYNFDQYNKQLQSLYRIITASTLDNSKVSSKNYNEEIKKLPDFEQFKKSLRDEIKHEIDWFNNNPERFTNSARLKSLYKTNKETQQFGLRPEAEIAIASYVFTKTLNRGFLHELMTPSIPVNQVGARNKLTIAPFVRISKKLKIEPVYFDDQTIEIPLLNTDGEMIPDGKGGYLTRTIDSTDSGQYVTEKTARKVAEIGHHLFEQNYGFKFINYKKEETNPNYKGKALALKGYTTIITKEMADKFPKLKVLYDALTERENKFLRWATHKRKNVGSSYGLENRLDYLAIATPLSSEKAYTFSPEALAKIKDLTNLDVIKNFNAEYHKMLNDMHYSDGDIIKGEFYGRDGSNFGPQMIMDKRRDEAKVPIQTVSNILSQLAFGNEDYIQEGLDIIESLNDAKRAQAKEKILRHIYKQDKDGNITNEIRSPEELVNYILSQSNEIKMDETDKYLLSIAEKSLYNPGINDIATNQVRNNIVRHLNNYSAPGTIAQQVSEFAGTLIPSANGVGTHENLRGYRERSDKSGFIAMEGHLPGYMANKNIRKREYYQLKSDIIQRLNTDIDLRREFGVRKNEYKDFFENYQYNLNGKITYYIPGETVAVTRVPASGPSFTGIMEVVDFIDSPASSIMVPSEFKDIIGSDDDGDQLFINTKNYNSDQADPYNQFLSKLTKRWLSNEMHETLTTPLDDDNTTKLKKDQIIDNLHNTNVINKDNYSEEGVENILPFTPRWERRSFNDGLSSSQTIGIGFNHHRILNGLATFGTQLIEINKKTGMPVNVEISINNIRKGKVEDDKSLTGPSSRLHQSNMTVNQIMDSVKKHTSEMMNINKHTIGYAMILANLGYDMVTIGTFLNQPIVKQYTDKMRASGELYSEEETQNEIFNEMKAGLGIGKFQTDTPGSYIIDLTIVRSNENINKDSDYEQLRLLKYLNSVNWEIETLNRVLKGHKTIPNNPIAIEKYETDFKDLISNTTNKTLRFDPRYVQHPEVKNYLNTLKDAKDILSHMHIYLNESAKEVYKNTTFSVFGQDIISEKKVNLITRLLKEYYNSKFLNINNELTSAKIEDLLTPYKMNMGITLPNGLWATYNAYVNELQNSNVKYDEDGLVLYNDLEKNKFLTEVLNLKGDPLKIFNKADIVSPKQIEEYTNGFLALPEKLQKELIIADFAVNKWTGNNSIQLFFGERIINAINKNANALNNIQNNVPISPEQSTKVSNTIMKMIMTNNNDSYDYEDETKGNQKFFKPIYVDLPPGKTFDKLGKTEELTQQFQKQELIKALKNMPSFIYHMDKLQHKGSSKTLPVSYLAIKQSQNGKQGILQSSGGKDADMLYLKVEGFTKSHFMKVQKDLQERTSKYEDDAFQEVSAENLAQTRDVLNQAKYQQRKAIYNQIVLDLFREGKIKMINANSLKDTNGDPMNKYSLMTMTDEKFTPETTLSSLFPENKVESTKETIAEVKEPTGREYRNDFNNFTGMEAMSYNQFKNALQSKVPIAPDVLDKMYSKYYEQKREANALYLKGTYTERNLSNKKIFDDDKLMEAYKEFGNKDIYAYSNIMIPIILEMNNRSANEQSQMIFDKTGIRTMENGKDISFLKAWLQTNNLDSTHPAAQAVQRMLETEFKKFAQAKKEYAQRIEKVTDALYQEKFNDKISSFKKINRLSRALKVAFSDRVKMYEDLYGNIIERQNREASTGPQTAIKLLSQPILDKKYADNQITKAEYDFANTFREIVNELEAYTGKKDFNTKGFIPAVAMTRMEQFSHRGLLGLITSARPENEAIYEVKLNYKGKLRTFKEIETRFRKLYSNNIQDIKEYVLLKDKAKKLLKAFKHEDGSDLYTTKVSNITMLGDGMIQRFTRNQFQAEGDAITMDLDKALYDYMHNALFVSGNKDFNGFLKLQALVDGLIIHNENQGFKNQNMWAKEVVKEGFLNKSRNLNQKPIDKVINGMVKGNLLWILGWKGLVLKHGVYAVGNAIVGKYHTIKNAGGQAWKLGERRYWGLQDGQVGMRKAQGILKAVNYNAWSVYDDVNMDENHGLDKIFTDIALSPMTGTENWIQGVHFLGLLTDEQWNKFDDDGNYLPGVDPISADEIVQIEDAVNTAHGKGYNITNQRLVQQYSWGKMLMQFSRFIPTMAYDRFAKDDITIYGKRHVGSLRLAWRVIGKFASGEIPMSKYKAYRDSLSAEERQILDSAWRGMGMMAVAGFVGQTFNADTLNELTGDANYLFNRSKLEYKILPSTVRTVGNLIL